MLILRVFLIFLFTLHSFHSLAGLPEEEYQRCLDINENNFNASAQGCAAAVCDGANPIECVDHFVGPLDMGASGIMNYTFQVINPCPYTTGADPYTGGVNPIFNCSEILNLSKVELQTKINSNSRKQCGSIVSIEEQSLAEVIPIVGTPFSLIYSTNLSKGRLNNFRGSLPITTATIDSDISHFKLEIKSESLTVSTNTYSNTPNLVFDYDWDGKNSLGVEVQGYKKFKFILTEYRSLYSAPLQSEIVLGAFRSKLIGLGGWAPSIMKYYDLQGRRLVEMDGSITQIEPFKNLGGQIYVVSRDESEVYIFDSSTGYHLFTKTGLLGATKFTFNYDSSGRLESISEPFSRNTVFNRDLGGNLVSITSPEGQVNNISLTVHGFIQTVTNPKLETYSLGYVGSDGLLTSFERPNGKISTFTYSAGGDLIKDGHSGGYFFDLVKSLGSNKETVVTSTTKMGRAIVTSSLVGENNQIERTTTYPDGTTSYFSFVEYPENSQYISASEKNISFSMANSANSRFLNKSYLPIAKYTTYGSYGDRQIENYYSHVLSDPADPFSLSSYSIFKSLRGTNTSLTSTFNPTLKKWTISTYLGKTLQVTLDVYERVVSILSGSLNSINFNYTNEKLTSISQGSRNYSFTYSPTNGKLSSITTPLSQTTLFGYDSANRITSQTMPDLRSILFSYDGNGNLIGVTPPGRPVHGFLLNSNDLVSGYQPPLLSGYSVVNTSYIYNDDKQLTHIIFPSSDTINYTYNINTGVLESITTPAGVYTYSYDYYGKLTSIMDPSTSITNIETIGNQLVNTSFSSTSSYGYGSYSRTFDPYFRVSSDLVSDAVGSSSINYLYNDDENLKKAGDLNINYSYPNGFISGTTFGSSTSGFADNYTYNTYGETTGYLAKRGTSDLYSLSVVRDNLGRVSQKTEIFNSITNVFDYTYDNSGRLIQVNKNSTPISFYGYDSNSNRNSGSIGGIATSANYDDQDRMLTYGVYDYVYSIDGYLTSKTNTLTNQVTSYIYDVFGNLTQVTLPSSDIITYEIDGLNRRISKAINGVIQKKWIYIDQYRIAAELNASGVMTKRFIYGSKGNIPDYMIASGIKYRIISDNLGSPRLVVRQSNGSVIQRMNHDEFGRITEDTNPGYLPLGFAGGLYDQQTGLVRFGARDYDSYSGRWTSKDPILFKGGDTNLFGYVQNDPVNFIDPLGLYQICSRPLSMMGGEGLQSMDPTVSHQYIKYEDGTTDSYGTMGNPFGGAGAKIEESGSNAVCSKNIKVGKKAEDNMKEYSKKLYSQRYNLLNNNCQHFVGDVILNGSGL